MKDIKFFPQHTPYTCGASCMQMLLYMYEQIPFMSVGREKQYYQMCHCTALKEPGGDEYGGITAAAIAHYLSSKELYIHLAHSSETLMDNWDEENNCEYFSPFLFEGMLAEYEKELELCRRDRVRITRGADISCKNLKEELGAGRHILLEITIPSNADGMHSKAIHWVLIHSYNDGQFLVYDPDRGVHYKSEAELERDMNTPIGKIYLSVSNSRGDHHE